MRTAAIVLLCFACVALPSRAGRAGPEDESGAKVHKAFNDLYPIAFRTKVNAAIDKGRAWLLSRQRPDGSWSHHSHHRGYPMGSTGLTVLTLLKCGVPASHPAIRKAFAYLRKLPMRRVYSVSVLLMALDARYAPSRDPFALETFDRYGNRNDKDPCLKAITPKDLAWMKEGVGYLLEHQKAEGSWRYPTGGFDLSNTQFALLGLHAASRCGTKLPSRVWLDGLRFCLGLQEKVGEPVMYKANEVRGRYRFEWTERAIARGFRYQPGHPGPTASMTTAGLTSLVVCQSRLWRSRVFTGRLRADARRGVRDAMAWLQQHFSVTSNPGGHPHWLWYYLYGLERTGILGRYRYLGTRDWYKEGAEVLLARQTQQGYWSHQADGAASCFALLFLKRATTRMNAPVITPSSSQDGAMPEQGAPRPKSAAARTRPATPTALALAVARAIRRLEDRDPDVVFQAANTLGWLGHLRATAPLVRVLKLHADADARTAAASALGRLSAAAAVPALIDALDDADPLVRHAAEVALLAVTQHRPSRRLRGASSRNDRLRLQKMWREHWVANEAAIRKRLRQPKGT